jgi:hypothetical protein
MGPTGFGQMKKKMMGQAPWFGKSVAVKYRGT